MTARKLPTLLALAFVSITLARVSHFADVHMHAGFLGSLFALCMGVSVFVVSMQTREHITIKDGVKEDRRSRNARKIAWCVLVPLVLAEGLFNLADVLSELGANEPVHIQIAAWVYGLFPTLIAAGLGMLQGFLDRLPTPPVRTVQPFQKLIASVYARLMQAVEVPPQNDQLALMQNSMVAPDAKPLESPTTHATPLTKEIISDEAQRTFSPIEIHAPGLIACCRACGWESKNTYATERAKSNAIAAHTRGCKGRKNGNVKRTNSNGKVKI